MSERVSAGLVMYQRVRGQLQVFLAHPGGPLFKKKDHGYWSIPKGEIEPGEDPLTTARREFEEEVGLRVPPTHFIPLGWIRQKGGKIVHAWGFEGTWPPGHPLKSLEFEMEWPPQSGQFQSFPEVDRAEFFSIPEARERIKSTQWPLLDRLQECLHITTPLKSSSS